MMEPDADNVTMYAPRYATKHGYRELYGYVKSGRFYALHDLSGLDIGRDVFRDLHECLAASEQLRLARIASLKKSLAKVEGVGPHHV